MDALEDIGFSKHITVATENPDFLRRITLREGSSTLGQAQFKDVSNRTAELQKTVLSVSNSISDRKAASTLSEDDLHQHGMKIRNQICLAASAMREKDNVDPPIADASDRVICVDKKGNCTSQRNDIASRETDLAKAAKGMDHAEFLKAQPLKQFETNLAFPADRATYRTLTHSFAEMDNFLSNGTLTADRLWSALDAIKLPLGKANEMRTAVDSFDQNPRAPSNIVGSGLVRNNNIARLSQMNVSLGVGMNHDGMRHSISL